MIRWILALSLAATSATGAEPAVSGERAARDALAAYAPRSTVNRVSDSALPGFYDVVADDQRTIFVSRDGRYLISGAVIDLASRRNLTEERQTALHRSQLEAIPSSDAIVFGATTEQKHEVTVFTDVDCGYCRKFHEQIAEYNRLGITVKYVFYPRAGLGSEAFQKAVAVWCSNDRREALTKAKRGEEVDISESCKNPVAAELKLGERIGVMGTPAIYAANGTRIGGYMAPTEMRSRLDALLAGSP